MHVLHDKPVDSNSERPFCGLGVGMDDEELPPVRHNRHNGNYDAQDRVIITNRLCTFV